MNLLAAFIVFNVLILLYQIMIEVYSAIFRIDGVQIDKAKFQIISILTGTGFTTNESELMLATRRRRKITQILILISYIFNITIVSTIVNIFMSTSNTEWTEILIGMGLTILNIILLIGLNKSSKIRRVFDNIVLKNMVLKHEFYHTLYTLLFLSLFFCIRYILLHFSHNYHVK